MTYDFELKYVTPGRRSMSDVVPDKFDVKHLGIFECDVRLYIRIGQWVRFYHGICKIPFISFLSPTVIPDDTQEHILRKIFS